MNEFLPDVADPPAEQIDLEALAYDIALRYDTPEDLALRYGVPERTLEALQRNPHFRQAVLVAEREITETGKEFKLKARKLSSIVLEELSAIALDQRADHSDRIKAISELTKLAGYAKEEGAGVGNAFAVNINLGQT